MFTPGGPPHPVLHRPKAHEIDRSLFQPKPRKPGQPRPPRAGLGHGQAGAGGMGRMQGANGSRSTSQGPSDGGNPAGSSDAGGGMARGGGMGRAGTPSSGVNGEAGQVSSQGNQAQSSQADRSLSATRTNGPSTLQSKGSGPSPLRMGKSLSSTSRPSSPNPSSSSFPINSSGAPIYRPKAKTGTSAGSEADRTNRPFTDFEIVAPTSTTQSGAYNNTHVNIFNFAGEGEVPRLSFMRQPIMLGRNNPDWERPVAEPEGETNGSGGRFGSNYSRGGGSAFGSGEAKPLSAFQKSQLALLPEGAELRDYKLDREGKVMLDEGGLPIKKEVADQSKIAPGGKAPEKSGDSAAGTGTGTQAKTAARPQKKKRFVREADKYRVGTIRPEEYWQMYNREKLPYLLDEAPLFETVQTTETDPDGQERKVEAVVKKEDGRRWIGRAVTAGDESAWIALVLTNDGQVIGVPVDTEYKFDVKRAKLDIAYSEANDIMEGRAVYGRWALRHASSLDPSRNGSPDPTGLVRMPDADVEMDGDVKPDIKPDVKPDMKPDIKPDLGRLAHPRANDVFGGHRIGETRSGTDDVASRLARRAQELITRDVKRRVKREPDEERGRRGRIGMERMEGEELDVEDGGPQSDEEGFVVGEQEEEEHRNIQSRIGKEWNAANRNVGVLEKVDSDEDSDEDLFGEKAAALAEEKKAERKRKRKLREAAQANGYDLPFDDDEDLDQDDTDTDEDEERSEVKASQDGGSGTGRSHANGDPKRSRHGSPAGSIHSPNSRAQSPNVGGTRSVSPSVSFGGHQLTAHRALSPGGGKGRSSTPGFSSGKSRKRKGEGSDFRQSAPPGTSSRSSSEMQFSKKQRPNTDVSHVGGSHASSSSQYLPSPSTGREVDLSGGHAGVGLKKHKKRGSNKEGRIGSGTPGGSGRSLSPSPSPSPGARRQASP